MPREKPPAKQSPLPVPDQRRSGSLPILLIMLAVLVWGLWLAGGAYLYNLDVRKPVVVLACVTAFLGVWACLLAARKRRKS